MFTWCCVTDVCVVPALCSVHSSPAQWAAKMHWSASRCTAGVPQTERPHHFPPKCEVAGLSLEPSCLFLTRAVNQTQATGRTQIVFPCLIYFCRTVFYPDSLCLYMDRTSLPIGSPSTSIVEQEFSYLVRQRCLFRHKLFQSFKKQKQNLNLNPKYVWIVIVR